MSKRLISFWLPVFVTLVLIASCAKMSSPTGGPKDKEPPVIIKSEPVNGQTNFREKKITITFDEFVALDKINEKFMVSPPMAKKPQVIAKGKSVIIEYEDELKDSTTYTFYFQDAIRDLNESNAIDNYQFVISTGNVVDSLSVTGNILCAYSLDPPDDALVLLYRNHADTAVMKSLPDYITKTSPTGYFRIDNVREGIYRLYALKDADNSKNFNLPDEEIAFMDTLIEVSAEKNYIPYVPDTTRVKTVKKKSTADTIVIQGEHQLILFKPEKTARYLTGSKRSLQYNLIYTLSLPPDTNGIDFSIQGAGKNSYFLEKSKAGDTLRVWITDSTLYNEPQLTTLLGYPFTDSLGNTIRKQDTVLLRFLIPRASRLKPKPTPFRVNSGFSAGSLKPAQEIVFSAQTPFREPDTSKIRIYEVKEKMRIRVPYKIEIDKSNSCRMLLHAELQQKKDYLYIADSAAFGNLYGEQSDSTGTRFNVRGDDTFSKLKLSISNFEGSRIIQLLNGQDKILRETKTDRDGITEFSQLEKGTYRLRVIYDLNGDGEWTSGDFLSKRQPEPVSFYPREIQVPENYWIDQDWDISLKNIKKVKSTPGANPGR
ncbi:MAG: Ig-like domain-containing domain [Bacteroidia bacterium]|nr:Ig-like domain-containing domain [Bacteroidia bacterium]